MNKVGVVLGVAVVATLAGCKDPDYVRASGAAQNEVKNAAPVEAAPAVSVDVQPAAPAVEPAKPIITADLSRSEVKPLPPPEPEYTVYIVQRGDFLSKIAKRYNIRQSAIRKLNPSLRNSDVVWVGMKLKLPGKIDVGEQKAPVFKPSAKAMRKSSYAPFAGATKEYVVKNGDSLGAVALASGISIRQLKELNGLSKDTLQVGQKLKVPAEKVVKAKPAKAAAKKATAKKVEAKKNVAQAAAKTEPAAKAEAPIEKPAEAPAAPAADAAAPAAPADVAAPAAAAPAADAAAPAAAAPAAPAEEAAPATFNYVVQEGDDIPGVAIRWGITTTQIRELNKLSESDQLTAGQVLKLPAEAQQ